MILATGYDPQFRWGRPPSFMLRRIVCRHNRPPTVPGRVKTDRAVGDQSALAQRRERASSEGPLEKEETMHKTFSLISGASLGAGLMYFFDPDRGRRRRGLMRDKGHRWSRQTRAFTGSTTREMQHRAIGMGAALKSWIQPTPPVSDRMLADRVRAKLGQFSRHPSAIDVHATDGSVTLSGPVLDDEFDRICNAIARIPGVAQIFNRLERHQRADVPALQESHEPKTGPRFALMQSHWSPTARTAAAVMGTAAMLYGLSRRTAGATTLAASGFGLLIRSATNQEFAKWLNFRSGSFGQI